MIGHRRFGGELKEILRPILTTIGFKRFKDHHLFSPMFNKLPKIVTDNGFGIHDVSWQPACRNAVFLDTGKPITIGSFGRQD